MVMIILAYLWIGFMLLSVLFIIIAGIVEKNFSEEHQVKKWWRKHVIGIAPNDIDI